MFWLSGRPPAEMLSLGRSSPVEAPVTTYDLGLMATQYGSSAAFAGRAGLPAAEPPPTARRSPGRRAVPGGSPNRAAVTGGTPAPRREDPPMQRWRRKTRLDAHRADPDDLLAILATRRHTDESLCHCPAWLLTTA